MDTRLRPSHLTLRRPTSQRQSTKTSGFAGRIKWLGLGKELISGTIQTDSSSLCLPQFPMRVRPYRTTAFLLPRLKIASRDQADVCCGHCRNQDTGCWAAWAVPKSQLPYELLKETQGVGGMYKDGSPSSQCLLSCAPHHKDCRVGKNGDTLSLAGLSA